MKYLLSLPALAAFACLSFVNYKPAPAIPTYKHVIVVVEENHDYNALIGSPNSPYISWLSEHGALFTDSHGVTHPSQANYIALFSGGTQGVVADECLEGKTFTTPNLGAALISKGFTFKGFAQTMPSVGFLPCYYKTSTLTGQALYGRKHCPWVNWQGKGPNNFPASLSQPMTAFPSDYNKLPTLAFVIPDMDYDMHNIGAPGDAAAIQRGDKWLKANIAKYAEWAKTHDSLLIVTFDEDDSRTSANQIPTIFYGAHVKTGKYSEHITHYNVLHTIEAMFKLPADDKQSAAVINDVWE
ncbi:alkaline phosphatase family protein [Mucilaginibacter sp. X5P1]|uniref:alkaline phosphatase family protein n=1 Tax=Mucilaginibacter sp. X5P1 TaxID=2723088 RepID=UPI00160CEF3E|nr:alkaline phosphatase family protein [Mucilaginibacter sp. X5P1]MBB6141159.1 acid phosphatase [Mucilaginibacter sp. X5P1]